MLRVEITAPKKADAMRAGRQFAQLHETAGKVVRFYDGDTLGEHEARRADVVIIVKQETSNGNAAE
jgi:hypothetical protein